MALLAEIEATGELADYQPFFAAQAYARAIALSANRAEQRLLSARLKEVESTVSGGANPAM
jgi:predicted RNA polymerase sigma factor